MQLFKEFDTDGDGECSCGCERGDCSLTLFSYLSACHVTATKCNLQSAATRPPTMHAGTLNAEEIAKAFSSNGVRIKAEQVDNLIEEFEEGRDHTIKIAEWCVQWCPAH